MADSVDFQPYLESLLPDPANQDWGDRYTPIQVELPLKVQTIVQENLGDPITQRRSEAQKPERFEVLEGLREALQENDCVLLVGKPGSGKSTALRRLLWEEAQTALELAKSGQANFRVPVLIELRSCSNGFVLEWIHKTLRRLRLSQEAIEDLLFDGRLLLLLDGLNELPSSVAWTALDEFRRDKDFHTTPIIVTTRELGAGADLGIEKKLEMLPLTELQMRDFIQKRLPGQADSLLRQLKDRLRELAETPLLLQMLCDVVAESKDGQIPQNRGELFRQEFARRYEAFKPLRGRVSEDSRRFTPELLQYLAFVMTQGDRHTDPLKPTPSWLTIPKAQAEAILETYLTGRVEAPAKAAKEWLEDLLEFHLLQVANEPDQIEFHHQLFQEYYAAEALLQKLPQLSDTEIKRDYLKYLKWTEALALMLAMMKQEAQALQVVKLALEVDLKLGARLTGEVRLELQAQTVSMIAAQKVAEWFKIFLLGATKSPKAVCELIKIVEHPDPALRRKAVWASRLLSVEFAMPVIIKAVEDPDSHVRETAIRTSAESDVEWAVSLAHQILSKESVPSVREAVVICILGKSNSEGSILALLQAVQDAESNVRVMASYKLEKISHDILFPVLAKILNNKNIDPSIRKIAANKLGELGGENIVVDLFEAQLDLDLRIHQEASYALQKVRSRLSRNDKTLENHKEEHHKYQINYWQVYLNSEEPIPRGNAVLHLTNLIDKEAAIHLTLQALNDPHHYVRGHAIERLIKLIGKKGVPQAIKALSDPHCDVRHQASQALAGLGANFPNGLELSDETVSNLIKTLNEEQDTYTCRKTIETLANLCRIIPSLLLDKNIENALLKASGSTDSLLCSTAIRSLGKFSSERTAYKLLQMVENSDFSIALAATEALKNMPLQFTVQFLSDLTALVSKLEESFALDAILAIQEKCKFYNYKIAQSASEEESEVSGVGYGAGAQIINNTYNIETVGNLNTGNVTVQGDQVGVKYESPKQDGERFNQS